MRTETKTPAGVVLSSASTMVGPLVTPTDDPEQLAKVIERAQPGIVVTPVWDHGDGFRSADGRTVEQILAVFQA